MAPCEGNGRVNSSTGENGRGDGGELHGERWGIGVICLRAVWIGAKQIKARGKSLRTCVPRVMVILLAL